MFAFSVISAVWKHELLPLLKKNSLKQANLSSIKNLLMIIRHKKQRWDFLKGQSDETQRGFDETLE